MIDCINNVVLHVVILINYLSVVNLLLSHRHMFLCHECLFENN